MLIAHVNSNGGVTNADVNLTKPQSGRSVTTSNLREDLNVDGSINSAEFRLSSGAGGAFFCASDSAAVVYDFSIKIFA